MPENEENQNKDAGRTSSERAEHIQIYNIVTSKDPGWQGLIHDLIASEQLDPWNIDIARLCRGYFDRIKEMEGQNFFVSSKILLAASLLLRIKSEFLLNKYIKEIDSVLFGKEEEGQKRLFERIELDESELPLLTLKSPLPRFKKVTLQELMAALDTAINTESRRISREIEKKQRERLAYVDIPKFKRMSIKDRIRQFYARILSGFKNPKHAAKIKIPYSHFTEGKKEEKVACFLPMLHLSNTNKIWLEQEKHFDELWIYMYDVFKKNFPHHDKELIDLNEELEEIKEELMENMEEMEEDIGKNAGNAERSRTRRFSRSYDNPLGDLTGDETAE